jgi:hypothetical protein
VGYVQQIATDSSVTPWAAMIYEYNFAKDFN